MIFPDQVVGIIAGFLSAVLPFLALSGPTCLTIMVSPLLGHSLFCSRWRSVVR